ncbi:MAG: hypothetical protein H7Z14_13020 [Anaerolineae bacterium]|nr:hypothetical protein [Phycisphaerae bacterium]
MNLLEGGAQRAKLENKNFFPDSAQCAKVFLLRCASRALGAQRTQCIGAHCFPAVSRLVLFDNQIPTPSRSNRRKQSQGENGGFVF